MDGREGFVATMRRFMDGRICKSFPGKDVKIYHLNKYTHFNRKNRENFFELQSVMKNAEFKKKPVHRTM